MSRTVGAAQLGAWVALLDCHAALVTRLENALEAAHGLSLAEYEVLYRLEHAPGKRLRIGDLVRYARMSKSGLSRLVDRMQGAKLLCTERCAEDRRGCFAILTPEGHHRYTRAAAAHMHDLEKVFGSGLCDSDARELERILVSLRDGVPEG